MGWDLIRKALKHNASFCKTITLRFADYSWDYPFEEDKYRYFAARKMSMQGYYQP